MSAAASDTRCELLTELDGIPEEYYPFLIRMIRTYRESVLLQTASESIRRGWEEAKNGELQPIDRLWEGIDAE